MEITPGFYPAPFKIKKGQVRILVGPMIVYGRATRLATGTGWKPVEHFESALWVQLPLLSLRPGPVLVPGDRL